MNRRSLAATPTGVPVPLTCTATPDGVALSAQAWGKTASVTAADCARR